MKVHDIMMCLTFVFQDEAEALNRIGVEKKTALYGETHSETLTSINNLGMLLKTRGKLEEALPFYERALNGRRTVMGIDHPRYLESVNNLAVLLKAMTR